MPTRMHRRPRRDPHDVIVLVVVCGMLWLAVMTVGILGALALRADVPSDLLLGALISTASGTIGAVGAVLTQTGRGKVEVSNTAAEPIPTRPVDDGPGDI